MKMFRFIAIVSMLMLVFSTQSFAKSTINEDFENTTIPGVYGAGGIFTENATVTNNDLVIESEDKGVYVNNYLRIKSSSEQRLLVTNSGVLSEDVTIVSAKMKFSLSEAVQTMYILP